MFGWGKKSDTEIIRLVKSTVRPLFVNVEARIGSLPRQMLGDPFVLGFLVGAGAILAQVETKGKASQAQKGLGALSAIQSAFGSHGIDQRKASELMQTIASNPEAKRGARAADLLLGVAAGMQDRDAEPEIVAAKAELESMSTSFRETLFGASVQGQLLAALQERLFLEPVVNKYSVQR